MKHHHTHSHLLTFAVIVTAVAFLSYLYVYESIDFAVNHAIQDTQQAQTEKARAVYAHKIASLYQTTANDWSKLPSLFIPADHTVVFIDAVQGIGPQTGSEVSLSSIDADNLDSAPAGTIGTIHGHVDAKGSWSALMRALMLAESLPYAVSIDHVAFSVSNSGEGKTATHVWTMSFDIQAQELVSASSANH